MKRMTVEELLGSANYENNLGDFCAEYYYSYIKNFLKTEEGLNNFISLLNWTVQSDETVEVGHYFEDEDYDEKIKIYSPILEPLIDKMVRENICEEDFYSRLWKVMLDESFFAEDIDKICVLMILISDPRIPYFELGPAMQMDNSKYREISNTISDEIAKSLFVVSRGYSQNTEVASQLYEVLERISDKERKIVLLANIIGFFNSKLNVLYEYVKENMDEHEE